MRRRPEMNERLLAKGTWDYALVDALTPEPGGDRTLGTVIGGVGGALAGREIERSGKRQCR